MSQLLTARYASKIRGLLGCFDRIVLTGTLPEICHPDGISKHLGSKGIRIFDFAHWAEPLNKELRAHAQKLAAESGLTNTSANGISGKRNGSRPSSPSAETNQAWFTSFPPSSPARSSAHGMTRPRAEPSSGGKT